MTFTSVGDGTELTVERNDGFPGAGGGAVGWERTLARPGADLADAGGAVG